MAEYDHREAQMLLKTALGRTAHMQTSRITACRILLDELAMVARECGIHVETPLAARGAPVFISLGLPEKGIVRLRGDEGRLFVRREYSPTKVGPDVEVQLDFDPMYGRFLSRERDEFIVPTPGEPWPRRSPLAVVVETVVSLFESSAE